MNEGCDGGWPLLGAFFLEDFYLPLEECAQYRASTKGSTCSDHAHCKKAVKLEKSYYIGDYYGAASELDMMKELRARGPIIGDALVPLEFFYYTSGIFSDDHA